MIAMSLAQIVERAAGLSVDRGGVHHTLDRHVAERMRKLELRSVDDYLRLLRDPAGVELRTLIEASTVQHTWFYRDPEQLQIVEQLLVGAPPGPIDIWIAGCATGEEAYTLAMIGRRIARELRMLATDVNESALRFARAGVYSALAVRDVPDGDRHLLAANGKHFVVDPSLRSNLRFERHNLVDLPPMAPRGAWDLIVCRNVLMYFAPAPAARARERFARALRVGGWLVLGASEIVSRLPSGLELLPVKSRLVLQRREALLARRVPAATPPEPSGARPPAPERARPLLEPGPRPGPPPPNSALVAGLNRGHALFERGDLAAAVEVYRELAERYADVAEVRLFLGIARFTHGDIEGAAEALRASKCLDPALWPAGFYLGRAYERLGRRADARQQYDQVAVRGLQPLALLSSSAVINELRAFQHDFQAAARRLATERAASPRRHR